jgi:hypothetical protein
VKSSRGRDGGERAVLEARLLAGPDRADGHGGAGRVEARDPATSTVSPISCPPRSTTIGWGRAAAGWR